MNCSKEHFVETSGGGNESDASTSDAGTTIGSLIISSPESSSKSSVGEGDLPLQSSLSTKTENHPTPRVCSTHSAETVDLNSSVLLEEEANEENSDNITDQELQTLQLENNQKDNDGFEENAHEGCFAEIDELSPFPGDLIVEPAEVEENTPQKKRQRQLRSVRKQGKQMTPSPLTKTSYQPQSRKRREAKKKLSFSPKLTSSFKQSHANSPKQETSPEWTPLQGMQSLISGLVAAQMHPLRQMLESFEKQITNTIREEINAALAELKRDFAGENKCSKETGDSNTSKPKRQPRIKNILSQQQVPGAKDQIDGKIKNNKIALPQIRNDEDIKPVEFNLAIEDGTVKSSNGEDTNLETLELSRSLIQNSNTTNSRIKWANKRLHSKPLVNKLKKILEANTGGTPAPFSLTIVENTKNVLAPPNSPNTANSNNPISAKADAASEKLSPSKADEESSDLVNSKNILVLPASDDEIQKDTDVSKKSKPKKIKLDVPNTEREIQPKPEFPTRKGKEAIICGVCGKEFKNKSSLKQHISFHRDQRPYQCEKQGCEKSYKTKSELNRHLIVHTGQKNHSCKQCGKKFLRKQYLKTHLLRHEEPLTWKCVLCSKVFVSEEDLQKHRVSYHKNGTKVIKRNILLTPTPMPIILPSKLETIIMKPPKDEGDHGKEDIQGELQHIMNS